MEHEIDKNTNKYMFRYLEKYTGMYRVLPEIYDDFPRDGDGSIDKSFDDLYIPCRKGVIKHTYIGNDILAVCFYGKGSTCKNVVSELKSKYKNLNIEVENGYDAYIYFNARDIDKIASVIIPRTSGAKIKWDSNKNLSKRSYEIPEKYLNEYNSLLIGMDKYEKMAFSRKCSSEFISSINAKSEMKKSGLNSKEYIYSINKWDDFIKFIKKKLK